MENEENMNELVQTFINRNHDLHDRVIKDFEEWIKQYMSEDTPENERILSYSVNSTGFGPKNDNSGNMTMSVVFSTENASKDSIWKEYIKGKSTYSDLNTCYIEAKILDEENYEITYIGNEPKNLKEFEKQFEEYKATHTETVAVSGDDTNNLNSANVVKLSNGISIVSGILIVLSVSFIIYKLVKINRRK